MSNPLKGVVAYVEVRSSDGKANYTDCVRQQLELLGAIVINSITQRCTHVVFKNGKMTTRLRANKSGATMVNVLWVEKCRELNEKVNESLYPVTDDPQDTPLTLRKTRSRFKSLQPTTLEKDLARSKEKLKRRLRRDKKDNYEPCEYKLNDIDVPIPSKLVWPPDHSDVCSLQEIAEYKLLEDDLRSTASESTECRENSQEKLAKDLSPTCSSPSTRHDVLPSPPSTRHDVLLSPPSTTKDVPPSPPSIVKKPQTLKPGAVKTGTNSERPSSMSTKNNERIKLNNESYFDTTLQLPSPTVGKTKNSRRVRSKKREVVNTNTNAFVIKATPLSKPTRDKTVKHKNSPKNLIIDQNIEKLLKHSDDLIKDFKARTETNPSRKVDSVPIKNNLIQVTEFESVKSLRTTVESIVYDDSDSLMSSYDPSQHYEGLNKTVDHVLETIVLSPQKRKPVLEISSDESFDELWSPRVKRLDCKKRSPKRRICTMTNSQKEGMFDAFDFNKDGEETIPLKKKQNNMSKTNMNCVIQHYPPIASRSTPLKISTRAHRLSSAKKPFQGSPLNTLEIIDITQPNVTKFSPSRRLSHITDDLDALFESVETKNKIINKSLSQRKSAENKSPMKSKLFDYHDIESPKKRLKKLAEDTISPSQTMISLLSNELCEDVSVMEEIQDVTYESEKIGEVRYEGDLDNSDVITKLQFDDIENNKDVLNQINSPTTEKNIKMKKRISKDGVEVVRKFYKEKDTSDVDWKPTSCSTRSSGRLKNKSKVVYNFSDEEVDTLPKVKSSAKKLPKRSSHRLCKTPIKINDFPEIEGHDTLGLGKLGDEKPPESPTQIIENIVNKIVEEIVVSENDVTLSPVYEKSYDIITPITITPLNVTTMNEANNYKVTPIVFHKSDPRSNNDLYPVLTDSSGNVQEPEISSTSDAIDLIVIEDDPELPQVPDVASSEVVPLENPQVSEIILETASPNVAVEPTSEFAVEQTSQGTGADTCDNLSTVVLQEKEKTTSSSKRRGRKQKVEKDNVFIRPRTSLPRSCASPKLAPKENTDVPESHLMKGHQKKTAKSETTLFFKKNIPPLPPNPETPVLSTDKSDLSELTRRQSKRSKKVSTMFTSDQYVLNSSVNIFTSPDSSITKPTCNQSANQSDSSKTKPTCSRTTNMTKKTFNSTLSSSNSKIKSPPKDDDIEKPNRRTGRSSKMNEESESMNSDKVETRGKSKVQKTVCDTKKKEPLKKVDRRSIEEFDLGNVRKTSKDDKKGPMYIVCTTSMHRDDQMLVVSTVRSLGTQYAIGGEITKDTTHVIVGSPRRTINLLKAIIWGCWIVKLDWVVASISSSKWLREDKFVIKEEFPVLKYTRQKLRSTAAKLFSSVGLVYVERETKPPRKDLVDLIVACGGQISMSKCRSDVCVGGAAQDRHHASVTELWVLDSISLLKLQKKTEYTLFPYHSPSPEF